MNELPSHQQLVKEIVEHTPEYNKYEHEWKFSTFFFRILLWGLFGAVLGGATQRMLLEIQGEDVAAQSRWRCAGFATATLALVGVIFYILLRIVSRTFDDWLLGTISGFAFSLPYFNALAILGENVNCVFKA